MGNAETTSAARGWNYILHISTSVYKTTKYGGRIYLILYNDRGDASRPFKYEYTRKVRANSTKKRRFPISNLQNFNSVVKIELWRESNEGDNDIYIDVIEIENCSNGERYMFPLQRWLKAYRHLFLRRYDCCLPQDDPNPIQRKRELSEKKIMYAFHTKAPGIPPQVEDLSMDERFSGEYMCDLLKKKYDLLLQRQITNGTTKEWNNLHELHDIYDKKFPLPEGIFNWRQDSVFGMQRLSGCNPTMIKLCTEIPQK
ncbi:polyunsaturated fatty acid 5-lipoxygenase-like [Glandiceps talaboti]